MLTDTLPLSSFRKENKETKALNQRLQDNKVAFRKGEQEQDLSGLINTRKPFTWENLTYTVPVPGGKKQLLDNVFGYVKPGTLTALMGSSGAGKTTLLDVLASRKTIGVIGGDILINGRTPGAEFQRGTGRFWSPCSSRRPELTCSFSNSLLRAARHSRAHSHRSRGFPLFGISATTRSHLQRGEGQIRRGGHPTTRARGSRRRDDRLPWLRSRR